MGRLAGFRLWRRVVVVVLITIAGAAVGFGVVTYAPGRSQSHFIKNIIGVAHPEFRASV